MSLWPFLAALCSGENPFCAEIRRSKRQMTGMCTGWKANDRLERQLARLSVLRQASKTRSRTNSGR